jgi:hypothetical protein
VVCEFIVKLTRTCILTVYECSVSGHSMKNKLDFQDHVEDFNEQFVLPWNQYANKVLPRKLNLSFVDHTISDIRFKGNENGSIDAKFPLPRDETSGLPLFPNIDEKMLPQDVREYCQQYFVALWSESLLFLM